MVITFAVEDCVPSVGQPVMPLAVAHAPKAAGIGDFLQEIVVLVLVEKLGQSVNLFHWILGQRLGCVLINRLSLK